MSKTKIYHGDTRHGGQAGGTEKCLNKKSKSKIKTQNTEKSRRAQKRAGKKAAENLREKRRNQRLVLRRHGEMLQGIKAKPKATPNHEEAGEYKKGQEIFHGLRRIWLSAMQSKIFSGRESATADR